MRIAADLTLTPRNGLKETEYLFYIILQPSLRLVQSSLSCSSDKSQNILAPEIFMH